MDERLERGRDVTDDEVPKPIASAIGHVCGVIGVAFAALSVWGIWGIWRITHVRWDAVSVKVALGVMLGESIAIGLTVLMFRWAGSLTGHWDTRGRLSVPKQVYAGLCALFLAMLIAAVGMIIVRPPTTLDGGLVSVFGTVSCAALAYLCYLATRRFN